MAVLSTLQFQNNPKIQTAMKKSISNYTAPELEMFAVAAERGYGDSVTVLPSFGVETDQMTFE